MKKVKKITMMIATAFIILSTTILAQTGTVNAPSGLVLRGEPIKGGSVITTIEDAAQVEILEQNGEWYKVKYNGQEGYLFAEYVKVEETETPPTHVDPDNNEIEEKPGENTNIPDNTGATIQIRNNARIYMMPLISSTPIGTLAAGATVTVEKTITNWSYVTDGTHEGWIRTYLINGEVNAIGNPQEPETPGENNPKQPTEQLPEGNTTETPSTSSTGTINVDFANVRQEASQTSEVVTTLAMGTTVTINSETEEWYKITYTGIDGTVYEGYIAKRLVTTE